MSVIHRLHKVNNFTVLDNNIFKNKELSYKAKGLLATCLSLPPDWDFNKNGLSSLSTDGRESINTAIKELQNAKYVYIHREKGNNGGWVWEIFEKPYTEKELEAYMEKAYMEKAYMEKAYMEKAYMGKAYMGKAYMENQHQLSTNIIKNLNNKELNNTIYTFKGHKPTCLEEVIEYCKQKNITDIDCEYFYNFYEANGWVQGKQAKPIKNWTCCITTFRKNNKNFTNKNDKKYELWEKQIKEKERENNYKERNENIRKLEALNELKKVNPQQYEVQMRKMAKESQKYEQQRDSKLIETDTNN